MRGFDEEERREIREGLVESAREQFLRVGPEKTTIEDLTDAVGIAEGTFYRFFDSKAALFMEVFRRLGEEQVEACLDAVEGVDDGREGIALLFRTYADWLEAHPLVQTFAADVNQGRFRRSLPAEQFDRAERVRDERLAEPVERWQANGSLREEVPATRIVGLTETLLLMAVRHDDYDEAYYERREFLIETLVRGLEP